MVEGEKKDGDDTDEESWSNRLSSNSKLLA